MSPQKTEQPGEKNHQPNKVNIVKTQQGNLPAELEETDALRKSVSGVPIQDQASHFQDSRFLTAQKQSMVRQVGQVTGNRQLQRALAPERDTGSGENTAGSGMVVQRGVWDRIREWWSDLTSSDPEDVVRNLDSGLERANTVLEAASSTTVDARRRSQIERLSGQMQSLQRVTGGIVEILDTAEKINAIEEFVDALNDIPDDISSDPEGAADAFGRLFASAGELGQELPQGPWTMYFEFLAQSRNFFTDMLQQLDPSRRWRRQFEEIEREAGNPTTRGVD